MIKRILFLIILTLFSSESCLGFGIGTVGVLGSGVVAATSSGNIDDFTGTQAPLATHDANWTASALGITNLETSGSGALRLTGTYRSGSAYYAASTSDTSVITVNSGVTDGYFQPRVCVRMSSTEDGYCFALMEVGSGDWTDIAVYKNGSTLCYLAGTYTTSTTHELKIMASGTSPVTIDAYVDGTDVTSSSCSDSTSPLPPGRNPGVAMYGASAGGYALNLVNDWRDYE